HIHKGLYGAFIIDPDPSRYSGEEASIARSRNPQFPEYDDVNEMVMVMNGFDTNFDGDNEIYAANSIAFAIECFRDDLHWLGTLVALLDGSTGIDFTGRVLLEQVSLQRSIESSSGQEIPSSSGQSSDDAELFQSGQRLRAIALARQAESLLGQPDPNDSDGWFRAWKAASRLMMRPPGATDAELERAVQAYRGRAVDRFRECVAALGDKDRRKVLGRTADRLADMTGETLTFMEDLPPAEAVQSLVILASDTAALIEAIDECGSAAPQGLRRRLRRQKKTVAAELQERRLGRRMERLFGHRAVSGLERLILLLLVLFMVMLAVEGTLIDYEQQHWPGSHTVEATCAWLDLGICFIFLAEFSLKWFLAEPRRLYFRRNWITGLVPAIPVGFIFYAISPDRALMTEVGEMFVLLRALRYLRLPQMARWLRFARPLVRAGRLIAFVLQASDRLVRRVAPLLNRNLVLFDRAAIKIRQPAYRTALASLRERFQYRATEVVRRLPHSDRRQLVRARIDDLAAVLSSPNLGTVAPSVRSEVSGTREIPLEAVIAWLLAATPAGISDRIGRSLAHSVARWARAFDVFGVRRLPIVRGLVVAGRRSSPYGTTAEVANHIGAVLQYLVDRVYWIADLYGTLTAPQLVDSIGEWMIKRSARPARRLLIVGLTFLAITSLAGLIPFPGLQALTDSTRRLIGAPLVLLGLFCLVPLLIGLWFRHIAGEATDFCSLVAEAQFITSTKRLKHRYAQQHRAVLQQRVIEPESQLYEGNGGPWQQATEAAVEQLFEDYLDGAPFHRSDTKTTTQLLGNLTLVSLRETRLGYGRRRQKQLRRLDLANTRSWIRGPYLWFHFISRSLAQHTAKLVVDYNAHAIPLERASVADEGQIRRYVEWLARRTGTPIDRLQLPEPLQCRWDVLCKDTGRSTNGPEPCRRHEYHGNDFTAVHFATNDADAEADIRRRYGDLLAQLMRGHRRDNIRRVFRTYPFHRLPKEQRTFNPLTLHTRYLAGGRVLLLPFRLLVWAARLTSYATRMLWTFVCDVLNPTVSEVATIEEPDPFAVAVRKIYRMRKPVFLECLRMRAEFDPEYLGASFPGSTTGPRRAMATMVEEDLALIDADPGIVKEFRQLASRRRRQMLEFRRLLTKLDGTDLSPESIRAMAIAYAIDYGQVRSRLRAVRRVRRALDELAAASSGRHGAGPPRNRSLVAFWCRLRYGSCAKRVLQRSDFAACDPNRSKAFLRMLYQRRGPLLRAVRLLAHSDTPEDLLADTRATLLPIGRDPAGWTRQCVILRAVQTLSVLDLKTYCDLVAELGEYDTSGVQ
ncbi:MAG: ion transporter, partial [Thermoguttaceae bacterium]